MATRKRRKKLTQAPGPPATHSPKLTPWIVARIREDVRALLERHGKVPIGWVPRIARELGVHRTRVWNAISGKTFKDCEVPPVRMPEWRAERARRTALARSSDRP